MKINTIDIHYTKEPSAEIDSLTLHNNQGNFIYNVGGKKYFVDFTASYPTVDLIYSGCASDKDNELEVVLRVTTKQFNLHPLFVPDAPKKMTLAQVEKELGYSISIVNK